MLLGDEYGAPGGAAVSAGQRDTPGCLASPPCYAHELDPTYAGLAPEADAQQRVDVARWRRAERARLLDLRRGLSLATRRAAADAVQRHLEGLLDAMQVPLQGLTLAAWWPIKAELDLRAWLASLARHGATAALPVVVQPGAALEFRVWTPDTPMVRGFWNIRVPDPAAAAVVVPDIVLAPVLGFDPAGYRLGYGGGYFDRTLAALQPRPRAIGIGLAATRIATIYPQPHDIPMQAIVTETGVAVSPDAGAGGA